MRIDPFYPQYDTETIDYWLEKHGHSKQSELPEIGFMAFKLGVAVAAGFLRRCEGNYGFLDSFVTNPNATAETRNEALDLLTNKLVKSAKDLGIKKLFAFSVDENTIKRAQRHGFNILPHFLVHRVIGE